MAAEVQPSNVEFGLKEHEPNDVLLLGQSGVFTNMFEFADVDYKTKEDAMNAGRGPMPAPDDALGWREFERRELAKGPRPVLAKRYRPAVKVHQKDVTVTYDGDNTYRILVHDPEHHPGETERPRAAVLWFHGGGWAHGSPEFDAERADFLASELRAVVFNVDYRLIPEFSWPQVHGDCYHSIGWVIEHAKEYNIDTEKVAIWGQSAGGHLAAGIALRDAVEHKPSRIRHVNLVVPVVCDHRKEPPPLSEALGIELLPAAMVAQFMTVLRQLTGSDLPSDDPYMSPLLTDIPAHHPPVYISVGGLDRLRDSGIAYALHLRQHGIDTQLEVVPGVPHAYTAANESYATKQFWQDQVKVLNMALYFDWKL